MKFLYLIYILFSIEISLAFEIADLDHFKIRDVNDDHFTVSITPYLNTFDSLEVRIDAVGLPKFFKKLNPTIAFGRDIDGNGRIDTWFLITKDGLETIRKEGTDNYGRDILKDVILAKYESSPKAYLSTITSTILSYILITTDQRETAKNEYYQEWMRLEELEIQLENEIASPSSAINKDQIEFQRRLIDFGYKQLALKLEQFTEHDVYKYAAFDIGLWCTGGIIVKWGGQLLARPLKMLSETSMFKFVSENISKFFSAQKNRLANKMTKIRNKISPWKAGEASVHVGIKTTVKNWRKQVKMSLQAYRIRRKLLVTANGVYKGIKKEWKYLVLNLGLQSSAEAMVNYDEIKDPNVSVMAGNLFSKPEVQQNIAFMATDTILMTGLSRAFKTKKARFLACGMLALTNSSFINFVVKREDNYERIKLDVGWEALIGNTQVQADLWALTFFETMADKRKNKAIKLLGYAFVVIDQTGGYYLYSKVSEYVEARDQVKNGRAILVPILAEE